MKKEARLYYVKLTNIVTMRVGYKIGVSIQPVKYRFRGLTSDLRMEKGTTDVLLEIIYDETMDRDEAIKRESNILQTYAEYSMKDCEEVMTNSSNGKMLCGHTELFYLDLRNINSNFYADSADLSNYKTQNTKNLLKALKFINNENNNIGKAAAAIKFGVSRNNLYLAEQLYKISSV